MAAARARAERRDARCRKEYYGEPADIWSCGIMLFMMLLGRAPYEQGKGWESPATLPPPSTLAAGSGISAEAMSLLDQMLVADEPGRRLGAVDVLEHPWFHTK